MQERSIIHLNVADFAVAVERVVDSRLRERPVIIAPFHARRAIVYDMSDEAYRAGVRKGMMLRLANRLCREAILLPPHPERYSRAMQAILKRVLPYSPLVEKADGDGHLFVDVTGTHRLFGPPPDIAWRIRSNVSKDLGLEPIWSVASNKLVAKVASRLVKPIGEYIVAPGEESSFLKPLPIALLPGFRPSEHIRLHELNLKRVGEVAALSMTQLSVLLGKRSSWLYEIVRGRDFSPVLPVGKKKPQVSKFYRFSEDTNDVLKVQNGLRAAVEQCGSELRTRGMAARRVGIIIEYADGMQIVRQATAIRAEPHDFYLSELATRALRRAWMRRIRIRRLHLICDRLIMPSGQLELFIESSTAKEKMNKISVALDTIRQRFGRESIRQGNP